MDFYRKEILHKTLLAFTIIQYHTNLVRNKVLLLILGIDAILEQSGATRWQRFRMGIMGKRYVAMKKEIMLKRF